MRAPTVVAAISIAFLVPQIAKGGSGLDERDEAYWAREALKTLCMGNRLDPAAALRQAEGEGWRPLPDGATPEAALAKDLGFTGAVIRWKASPRGQRVVLILGDGGKAGPGCAVMFDAPFATASSVIGGHFMLPVRRFDTVGPQHHLWAFVEEPGKRRRAVKSYFGKIDHARIAQARARRTFSTIAVIGRPQTNSVVFLYSVPPPIAEEHRT